jgi:hypothetical protein
MATGFHARWTCSYMGCVWYEITDATGRYEVEVRHRLGDYERSILNGPQCVKDCETAIGGIHRSSHSWEPVPAETVAAFNAWRMAEYEAFVAKGRLRGWDISEEKPPEPVRGIHYVIGAGWIDSYPAAISEAA